MEYNEIKEIGQGGFAKVILVQNEDNNKFAKKVFSPLPSIIKNVGENDLKRRFIREVKYQSSLKHRNIVEIIESYLTNEPPFFIMPLADCTLRDELIADSTLNGKPNLALFDILAGLEVMHNNGYTHRDLKPANILKFTNENETKYAISDFGLITSNQSESSTLTGTNAGGGTENYAAPELNGGFRRATFAADIYSFGAILHDIFGNKATRIPYTELTLSGEIGSIISKCTKRLPIRRYKSVSELREDLYNVLNTQEVHFNSTDEEEIVKLLREKDTFTDDDWDKLFLFIDECMNSHISCNNIFDAISAEHIKSLTGSPELFNDLGFNYCQYIKDGTFNFDYCDILASKAQLFYEGDDIGLKAEVAISMLLLGTSHNRWYVEQKYMKMINNDISDELAKRIKIELEVQDINFKQKMRHVKESISASLDNIHPILLDILKEES